MKKILITQRHERIGKFNELRDNIDIRYSKMIENIGMTPILMPNSLENIPKYLDQIKPNGILLTSGGNPKFKDQRNLIEIKLIKYSLEKKLPLVGICRGAQVLNIFFGGKITRVKNHVRKNHIIYGKILGKKKKILVNSYHDFGIYSKILGNHLDVLANANDNTIECFKHKKNKLMGIMWHPERYKKLRNFEKKILKSFY